MSTNSRQNINDISSKIPESSHKFLEGLFNPESTKPQALSDSYNDKQIQVIIPFISVLVFENRNNENILIDYGCGDTGNLFHNLFLKKDSNFLEKIQYFGLEYNKNFDKMNFKKFDEIIMKFGNKNKNFDKVFLPIDGYIYNNNSEFPRADYIILKNVVHEINLIDFPRFLKNLSLILKDNGYVIIYDMSDFNSAERRYFPYNMSDIEEIFCEILSFELCDQNNYSANDLEGDKKPWVPTYLLLFKKTNNCFDTKSEEEIKHRIFSLFKKKENEFLKLKKNYDNMTSFSNEQIKYNQYHKFTIYHSNCREQIHEAEEKWGL